MIQRALDILDKNFYKIDVLDGVKKVQEIFYQNNIECSAVYDKKKLVGVLTLRELGIAHPNRIVADAMSNRYICVGSETYVWDIKKLFNSNEDIDVILVEDRGKAIGFITKNHLKVELGKHIDLLTGLYKSDYLFYHLHTLIEQKQKVSLIFIDLNNFGYIDKKFGHINGDTVLKIVAGLLRENIQPDNFLCRYAGDEFAILTSYSEDKCKVLSEKILMKIKEYSYPSNIKVSASIGVVSYNFSEETIDNKINTIKNLVNAASLASTKAKQSISNNPIFIEKFDIMETA
ncbi:diguanylate cyclase domain-containing protein [Clostridium amazonitimonense]|uniref:diguanylate cyclase domain-containing protein n=1 Tax=Clostridium amazonitimonense TaxID=1499689 RepID=UPI000509779A|nr:GGDEF domain-containing protein [Clostridium amazonitimonense]